VGIQQTQHTTQRQLFTMHLWFLAQNLQTLSTIATYLETVSIQCQQQGSAPS